MGVLVVTFCCNMNLLPIIVAGPSGVGKSTLLRRLLQEHPDRFGFSVSHTTRDPRPGEENGVHYHFVTESTFEELIKENQFIEHAIYNNHHYGTSKQSLENVKKQQKIALLDIDMCGVATIQNSGYSSKFVFIEPPSVEELRKRLVGRGDTSAEAIENRINIALDELEKRKQYRWDFTIIGHT